MAHRGLEPYVIYLFFKCQLIMTIFEGGDRFWMILNKIGFFRKVLKICLIYLHKIAKNNYFPNFGFIVVFYPWTGTMDTFQPRNDYLWPRNSYFSSFLRTLVPYTSLYKCVQYLLYLPTRNQRYFQNEIRYLISVKSPDFLCKNCII